VLNSLVMCDSVFGPWTMVHAKVWAENHVQPGIIIIMPWVMVVWWGKGSDARIQFLIYLYIGTKLSSFQKKKCKHIYIFSC